MASEFPDQSAFAQHEQLEFEAPEVPAPVMRAVTSVSSPGLYDALELLDQAAEALDDAPVTPAVREAGDRIREATEILRGY